MKHIEPL